MITVAKKEAGAFSAGAQVGNRAAQKVNSHTDQYRKYMTPSAPGSFSLRTFLVDATRSTLDGLAQPKALKHLSESRTNGIHFFTMEEVINPKNA
ncbi:MAG TPA: hypothetical protein VLC08_08725 [Chitinolyticbacter sp.]|nr:hypothetical protein [Chitinolyticbacter sp.]